MIGSEVEVCNQALGAAMVRSQIASMDDANVSARACKLYYAMTRDELLSEAPWGFAQRWRTLALKGQASATWTDASPTPGFQYQYGYPVDCIRCNLIIPKAIFDVLRSSAERKSAGQVFELSTVDGETRINTNAEQAVVGYTERVADPSRWTTDFGTAMVARLAYRICVPLSGDKVMASSNFQLSNMLAARAREGDGNEGLTVIDHLPDWLAIRDAGDYGTWGH
jgi:hypothetical protein